MILLGVRKSLNLESKVRVRVQCVLWSVLGPGSYSWDDSGVGKGDTSLRWVCSDLRAEEMYPPNLSMARNHYAFGEASHVSRHHGRGPWGWELAKHMYMMWASCRERRSVFLTPWKYHSGPRMSRGGREESELCADDHRSWSDYGFKQQMPGLNDKDQITKLNCNKFQQKVKCLYLETLSSLTCSKLPKMKQAHSQGEEGVWNTK